MLSFLRMNESDSAACVGVFAGKHYITSNFFHSKVAYVTEGTAAGRAARQLGSAAGADEMSTLALEDGRQDIIEAHGALE